MTLHGCFILDTNFFISLYNIKKDEALENLKRIIDELKLDDLYSSNFILSELKIPQNSINNIKKWLKFITIPIQKIEELSNNVDPRTVPQEADLSLVALANVIQQKYEKKSIIIVTDDFKLGKFVHNYAPQFSVLPPSSFLMLLSNNLDNYPLRNYFKVLRKKLLNYEVSYALNRKELYKPEEKLSWLVDKAINVACQCNLIMGKEEAQEEIVDSKRELSLINRFILGEKLSKSQLNSISNFIPYLKSIKNSQKEFNSNKKLLIDNRVSDSLTNTQKIINELMITFQLSMASLKGNDKEIFQKIITRVLAQFEFFISTLYLELNELDEALDHFDKTIVYSFLADQSKNIIIANYIKGLSLIFNNRFKEAAEQFSLSQKLAEKFKFEQYRIINMGGEAIALSLAGENEKAQATMEKVDQLVEKNLEMSLFLMIEFADNFYVMSRPEIAFLLYKEALEISIELNKIDYSEMIVEKLKRCLYASGIYLSPATSQMQMLIDLAHQQKSSESIEKFNEEISKIGEINKLLFEDFPFITRNKWINGIDLPDYLKQPMDLISIINEEKTSAKGNIFSKTTLICLNALQGGIAINVPEPITIKTPELYKVQLNEKGVFKITQSSQTEKEKFFIRANIFVKSKEDLIIQQVFPQLYGKFFD